MKEAKSLWRRSKVGVAIGFALLLACSLVYIAAVKLPDKRSLPEMGMQQTVSEPPELVSLGGKRAADAIRNHMLDGDFKILKRVQEIPETCKDIFRSSFVDVHGLAAKSVRFEMADPGQTFQSSDALIPGAPFRRLVFAGSGPGRCFIYYQHGGKMYPSYCLAIMDYKESRILWLGESRKVARSINDLRTMVRRGLFVDDETCGC